MDGEVPEKLDVGSLKEGQKVSSFRLQGCK